MNDPRFMPFDMGSLQRTGQAHGYIEAIATTSSCINEEARRLGSPGWTPEMWEQMTAQQGGASYIPLLREHNPDQVVGRVLSTQVNHRGQYRLAAMFDMQSELGRQTFADVMDKRLPGVSIRADMYTKRDGPASNFIREISVVAKPFDEECLINVCASAERGISITPLSEMSNPSESSSNAPAAAVPAAAVPAAAAPMAVDPSTAAAAASAPAPTTAAAAPDTSSTITMTADQFKQLLAEQSAASEALRAENKIKRAAEKKAAAETAERMSIATQAAAAFQAAAPLLDPESETGKAFFGELSRAPGARSIMEQMAEMAKKAAAAEAAQRRVEELQKALEDRQTSQDFEQAKRLIMSQFGVPEPSGKRQATPQAQQQQTAPARYFDGAQFSQNTFNKVQQQQDPAVTAAATPASSTPDRPATVADALARTTQTAQEVHPLQLAFREAERMGDIVQQCRVISQMEQMGVLPPTTRVCSDGKSENVQHAANMQGIEVDPYTAARWVVFNKGDTKEAGFDRVFNNSNVQAAMARYRFSMQLTPQAVDFGDDVPRFLPTNLVHDRPHVPFSN